MPRRKSATGNLFFPSICTSSNSSCRCPIRQPRRAISRPPSAPPGEVRRWPPAGMQTMHRQFLTAEECVGSGPGLKAAPAVIDLSGRATRNRPGHLRAPGSAPAMRLALSCGIGWIVSASRPVEGLEHQACAVWQPAAEKDLLGGLIGFNRQLLAATAYRQCRGPGRGAWWWRRSPSLRSQPPTG